MNTYLLITGGTVSDTILETVLLEYHFQKVIAADKGIEVCHRKQIMPDVIVGDFDSADRALVRFYQNQCECMELPVHKDQTDTHVALLYALNDRCDSIIILGASGSRLDHTLANIGLLRLCLRHHVKAWIIDACNRISLIQDKTVLTKDCRYPYVSLIPYTEQVTGLTLSGFAYSGTNLTLNAGESLGISNALTGEQGTIAFASGELLVIESHD